MKEAMGCHMRNIHVSRKSTEHLQRDIAMHERKTSEMKYSTKDLKEH